MKLSNTKQVNVESAKVKNIVNNESLSKSKRMIELLLLGLDVKTISQLMNVRYNFVYNVVSNYINVNGLEVESTKQESKKDKIIELFLAGKSNKEISIELKTNYNYVYNVVKSFKQANNEAKSE